MSKFPIPSSGQNLLKQTPSGTDVVSLPSWVLEPAECPTVYAGMQKSPADQDATFLTIKEAAALLRVSSRSVRRHLKSGKLSGFRIGRSVRISRADINAFVGEGKIMKSIYESHAS